MSSKVAAVASRQSQRSHPKSATSKRAVFFLPETYLANVDAFAGATRISKCEVVRLALESFFTENGMNAEKNPRLVVQFEYD